MLYIWKGRKKMFFPHFYIGELQFLSRDWKNVCVYARAEEREKDSICRNFISCQLHMKSSFRRESGKLLNTLEKSSLYS